MKRLLILLSLLFCNTVCADTINLYWKNYDGTTYQNSTCVIDSDLIIPSTPPTKYGYTFTGWKMSDYTPIEYLESTGTQYIDTGFKFSNQNNYRVIIKYEYTNVSAGQSIAGAQPSYYFIPYIRTNGFVSIYHSSLSGALETPISVNTVYTLEMTQNSNIFTLNINGTTESKNTSPPSSIYSYFLFATSNRFSAMEYAKIKMYFVQIYENDALVRDFIPVLDQDNIPCLFDKVEAKFYYNQGTGQFIAGPVL